MRFKILVLSAALWIIPSVASAGAIHDFARKGDVAGIAATLDAGADVNGYDGFGTPLTHAVGKGHFAAAKLLIERGANVNMPTRYAGEPVMLAAERLRSDLVKLLLENGAIPDSTLDGRPVLHLAALQGCFGCVEALVEAGADVNWQFKDGCLTRTALGIAEYLNFSDMAAYLKTHGATHSIWVYESRNQLRRFVP